MSKNKELLAALISEDIVTAKKLVNESLMAKLGDALEEKLANFAPSIFNEAKMSKAEFAAQAEPKDKATFADKLALIKKKKNVQEGWTSEISNAEELAKYLGYYQMTGKMPRELAAYFAANPSMGAQVGARQIQSQPQPDPGQMGASMMSDSFEPDMEEIVEDFSNELLSIVEEIEQEIGEKLSEEEIMEVAEQYLSVLEENN